MRRWPLLLALTLCAANGYAGPNWQAIENAREEKISEKQVEQKEVAMKQIHREKQQSARERLEVACARASKDAELSAACDEILKILSTLPEESLP